MLFALTQAKRKIPLDSMTQCESHAKKPKMTFLGNRFSRRTNIHGNIKTTTIYVLWNKFIFKIISSGLLPLEQCTCRMNVNVYEFLAFVLQLKCVILFGLGEWASTTSQHHYMPSSKSFVFFFRANEENLRFAVVLRSIHSAWLFSGFHIQY